MRIATNVTREYIGGLTRANVNFLDFFHGKEEGIIGIEINARRHVNAPTIFQHLSSAWFNHHIVNVHDISIFDVARKSKTLKDVEKQYRPIINIIKEIFIKEKPDVIFLNGTYYIPWIISIAAHELKIPIVLRYAGIYSKETEHMKPKFRKIFNAIEKSFQKSVNYFIFPSQLCKNIVENEIIGKAIKKPTFIIPNSVNIITSEQIPIKSVERRIAAIGRWDKIKNFQIFFKIHKELLKTHWRHEASFVTNEVKIKNAPKTIKIFAPMTHKELFDFYSSQGLIICPSLFETFGNVAVEAACIGIPVLVNENMGCAEVLKMAGLENMVISFKNIKEVVERVKKLCGQQIMPKQMNNLKKFLNPKVINSEIMSILRNAAENN